MPRARRASFLGPVLLLLLGLATTAFAEAPISYRLSFPEPHHRWMQIEVVFPELGTDPLRARMSRSSAGRYALHEFAKNVYDLQIFDGRGRPLRAERPDPHQWVVTGHDGTVRMVYKLFGDRVDGTYLAVDSTHAHMNLPATLMWASGLEERPAELRFEQPPGGKWRVATQLFPSNDPLVYSAPNLQYLMDSPVEFSGFDLRTFTVESSTFRMALHHLGTEAELDRFVSDAETLVREARAVFGEFPIYDAGSYTFIADYLPYADGDGMEHSNSTILTSSGALREAGERQSLLSTVAHEFFHCWNVERIRPKSLEPFDFTQTNISAELWLAEGFTSYYESLLMRRAGLATLDETSADFGRLIEAVTNAPGRHVRSAADMSRHAPFVDAARSVDRTNWENTFISYYTWGAAIGLGLDLSLRVHSDGRVTLDDFMRAMWRTHGKPAAPAPGLVAVPYTMPDARDRLAEVSSDRGFAQAFFDRYIEGHEVVDYKSLLAQAGFVLRKRNPGRATLGDLRLEFSDAGAKLSAASLAGSPAHAAGLDRDDMLLSLDGEAMTSAARLEAFLKRHRPGDRVAAAYIRRGARVKESLSLGEDPELELVSSEKVGQSVTAEQRAFRDAWLGKKGH